MEQQQVVEPFEKIQQPHQTLPFHCDSEMTHTQNPPSVDDKDFETKDLGLGSEVDELAVFEPVRSEKLSLGEDGMLRDGDFDDEVARVIMRELKELVLSQAMSEQKGSVESLRSYEWGEYEEEEYEVVENGEEKWGREEGFGEVGDVENENGDDNWGEFDAKKMGYEYEGFGGVGNVENGNGEESWGREDGKFNGKKMVYPLRPDAEDCAFYMKTGSCKFGFHCKFNHPPVPRRKYQAPKDKIKPREEHLERSGQAACKYFLSSAGCKYGQACKYNHSRERSTISPASEFNFLGLPIRPGEQECPYYMRNGSCKYGSNCRFHHPDPTAGSGGDPSPYGNGASQSSPRALSNAASFVPIMYPPAQGVHSSTDWSGYQASVYPPTERSLPTPPAFTMNNMRPDTNYHSRPVYSPIERTLQTPPAFTINNLGPEANFHSRPVFHSPPAFPTNNMGTDSSFPSRHHQPLFMDEFPERPGQPECSYFLKTGDCKYKSNCKFHHPKSRVMKSPPTAFSDKGLPLRPEEAVCSFYLRYGICKFGPACKFDHPDNLGNSVHSPISEFEQSSFGNAVA